MKITSIRIFLSSIFLALLITHNSQAQDDFDRLLEAGVENANILLEGYVGPALEGFGTGLGNGWYNTAATHRPAGFDLTVTVNAAYVPDRDLFYSPNFASGLSFVAPADRAPTIFGPKEDLPVYQYDYEFEGRQFTGTFEAPEGLDLEEEVGFTAVPVPMAQLGIGIIKNTDIKIRWTPEIDLGDDGTFKLIGFGIQHDIKQYIPGIKLLPFDLALFAGYTSISSEVTFETDGTGSGVNTTNGMGIFDVNTLTVQALISKKFSVITFYGGLGFNSVRSELALEGDYEVTDDNGNVANYSDPISLKVNAGGPRLTAGMRLKLAILTLHADYTLQEFNTLTVGVGFTFREKKSTK